MMKHAHLSKMAMAWVFSIFGGVATFIVAVLGQVGLYIEGDIGNQFLEVVEICNPFYIFDLSTLMGVFFGTLEALVFWFIVGWVFAWLYNKFTK